MPLNALHCYNFNYLYILSLVTLISTIRLTLFYRISYSEFLYISCKSIIEERNLPIIIDYIGNKGCLTFIKKGKTLSSLNNYQDYIHNVDTILEQLFVFYFINRGIWVQTRDEWSISFQHTKDDIDAYVACFRAFADKLVELKV